MSRWDNLTVKLSHWRPKYHDVGKIQPCPESYPRVHRYHASFVGSHSPTHMHKNKKKLKLSKSGTMLINSFYHSFHPHPKSKVNATEGLDFNVCNMFLCPYTTVHRCREFPTYGVCVHLCVPGSVSVCVWECAYVHVWVLVCVYACVGDCVCMYVLMCV